MERNVTVPIYRWHDVYKENPKAPTRKAPSTNKKV